MLLFITNTYWDFDSYWMILQFDFWVVNRKLLILYSMSLQFLLTISIVHEYLVVSQIAESIRRA